MGSEVAWAERAVWLRCSAVGTSVCPRRPSPLAAAPHRLSAPPICTWSPESESGEYCRQTPSRLTPPRPRSPIQTSVLHSAPQSTNFSRCGCQPSVSSRRVALARTSKHQRYLRFDNDAEGSRVPDIGGARTDTGHHSRAHDCSGFRFSGSEGTRERDMSRQTCFVQIRVDYVFN